jgi:hypothetical protein
MPAVLAFFGILFGWLCASKASLKKKVKILWLSFAGFIALGMIVLALLWQGPDNGGLGTLVLVIFMATIGAGFALLNLVMGYLLSLEARKRRIILAVWTMTLIVLTSLQAIGILPSGLLE